MLSGGEGELGGHLNALSTFQIRHYGALTHAEQHCNNIFQAALGDLQGCAHCLVCISVAVCVNLSIKCNQQLCFKQCLYLHILLASDIFPICLPYICMKQIVKAFLKSSLS